MRSPPTACETEHKPINGGQLLTNITSNHFSVILRIGPCEPPRRHPQLAVGMNIHESSQVASVLVQEVCHISRLNLRERSRAVVSIGVWVITRTTSCFKKFYIMKLLFKM